MVKRNGHLCTHGRLLTRPATSDSCRQDTEVALAFSMQNLLDLMLPGHAASSKNRPLKGSLHLTFSNHLFEISLFPPWSGLICFNVSPEAQSKRFARSSFFKAFSFWNYRMAIGGLEVEESCRSRSSSQLSAWQHQWKVLETNVIWFGCSHG